MGGEPLLNPSIVDWIGGLNDLWPENSIQVLTNGTRLTKTKGLYDAILNRGNWLGISWHNKDKKDELWEQIYGFLDEVVESSHKPIDELQVGDTLTFRDKNTFKLVVWVQNEFGPAAIKVDNGQFTLYNNDPEEVHPTCGFVQDKCYHMIEAKLYKCGPVALFPEFDKQHRLNISDEDRQLINSYQPLSVDEFPERGEEFLKHIDDVIPQCKFCPVGWQHKPEIIYPTVKNKS